MWATWTNSGTRWVGFVGILMMLGACGPACAVDPKDDAIYAAAENAVSRRQVEKTRMLGFSIEKAMFSEMPPEGAVLVGFDFGVGKFMDIESIYAIRAVYRSADGEASYSEHGLFKDKHGPFKNVVKSKVLRTVRIRARPGYAVGGLTIRSGLNINGLSATFMRISGTTLDPRQAYESEWVGDRTGGHEASVGREGAPVVGVFGNEDKDHVMALGLICIKESRRAAASPVEAPPPRKPAEERAEQPVAERPARPQMDPLPRVIDKHRDHEHHFALSIPDGWKRMSANEMDRIHALIREHLLGNLVHYEAGFRPANSSPGTYPYVLLQVIPVDTTGMTYRDIQRTLDIGIDAPLKTVEGAFPDVLRNASAGTPVLDRGRDRIVLRMGMDVFGAGRIEGLSVSHLGKEGIVSIHGYARDENFESYVPLFTDLNNSFEFEDGYDFVAAKESNAGSAVLPFLVFGLVTIPLGLAFLAFTGWKRRAPPAKGWPNGMAKAAAPYAATPSPPSEGIRPWNQLDLFCPPGPQRG